MITLYSFRECLVERVNLSSRRGASTATSVTSALHVMIIIVPFAQVNLTLGVWIGNCVGYSNTHLFLLFILVNNLLLTYSSYLHYLVFSHKVAEIRLIQKKTIASFGAALHSVKLRSTYQLYSSVILEAELGGALFLICAMMCAVTAGFMLHHGWLLSTGTTTNESFKWADLKDALAVGEIVILGQDDPFMYAFM